MIVVNHQGSSRGEYDMQPVEFGKHDFSVIYPNHSIIAYDTTDDYLVTIVVISSAFFEHIQHRLTYGATAFFHDQPLFQLSDKQYECVCDVLRLIKSVSQMDIDQKEQVLADIIDVLSRLARSFRLKLADAIPEGLGIEPASGKMYFYQFYNLLVEHYKDSREVAFYANKLCISAKYFGTIIKKETGEGPGVWIARYVISRSKAFLRQRLDMSIQQISQILNFPDASSFARYFRKNSGMTAREYRDQFTE